MSSSSMAKEKCWHRLLVIGFFIGAVLPCILFSYMRMSPYVLTWLAMSNEDQRGVLVPSTLCRFRVVNAINQLPPDALVLALRPADMYYAGRRMVSYLDPRLLPFYEAKTSAEGYRILRDLGIRYVQSTPYSMPVLYNSQLVNLLADARYSHIVYSSGREALYELAPHIDGKDSGVPRGIGPDDRPWVERGRLLLVGGYPLALSTVPIGKTFSPSGPLFPVFLRDQEFIQQMKDPVWIDSRQEQVLTLTLSGRGFARLIVSETADRPTIRERDKTRENVLLFDVNVTGEARTVSVRFMPLQDARNLEVGISQRAGSEVKVESLDIRSVDIRLGPVTPSLEMASRCRG